MARKPVEVPIPFLAVFPLVLLTSSLFGQQVGIQSSFFAPAAAHISSGAATIHETENYPYLASVQKEVKPGAPAFQPNPSDLLIQQAEERFNLGKKLFDSHNYDQARAEFDAAIDDMLGVSVAGKPSDPSLFKVEL